MESLARRLARRVDGETTTQLKKQQAQQEQTLKGVMRHAHHHPQTNEKEDEEAEEEEEEEEDEEYIRCIFLSDDDFAFGSSMGFTFPPTVEPLLRAGPSSLGQVRDCLTFVIRVPSSSQPSFPYWVGGRALPCVQLVWLCHSWFKRPRSSGYCAGQ